MVCPVAEEVEPHRKGQVAGEHIHGAAAHGEGARTVQLAGVGVAGGLQGAGQVAQLLDALDAHILKLLAGRKRDRPRSVRLYRRQQAQQRPGTTTSRPLLSAQAASMRWAMTRRSAGLGSKG